MSGTTSNDARGPGAGRLGVPSDDPAPSVPGVAHLAHTGMVRISPDASGAASVSMTPEGEAPRVSAVIPTMNEAANLPDVLSRLPECVDEVIIVDGHSTDDTIAVARAVRPDARVVVQTSRGKGNALACGFAMCSGEIIVMLDADGSTDPLEIPLFVSRLLHGADFVKGSRYMPRGGSDDLTSTRRWGNRVLTGMVNGLFGVQYTDLCYGYMAFWRRCLPQLAVDCTGFEVETLLTLRAVRADLDVVEVPSVEHDRMHGLSHLHPVRDGLRVLRTIISERISRDRSRREAPPWAALTGAMDAGTAPAPRMPPSRPRVESPIPELPVRTGSRRAAEWCAYADELAATRSGGPTDHPDVVVIVPTVEVADWISQRVRMPGVQVVVIPTV
jgi:hypothetical protein